MHTLRLNLPDLIYSELMSFLKKYPIMSLKKILYMF